MKTAIIADSTCDLPAEIIENYDIEVLPFTIHINDHDYLDGITITTEQLYQAMRNGQRPTTSQISPLLIRKSFINHAEKGEPCIYIAFSAAMSGAYQTSQLIASEVKELYPDFDIDIIDSKGGSLATGIVVYQAARMAQEGKTKKEIVDFISFQAPRMEHIFTVDNLETLHQGGRVSRTGAIIGNMLNIKPILHVQNGEILLLQMVRGRKKVWTKLLDIMEARCVKTKEQIIGISHADDLETALKIKNMIQERFGFDNFIVNLIGSVLGAHIGIGGVGLFFPNEIPA
ncbi:MAG TPA: DegV family protein [Syntrophomonadaceae bacterium]|nr:DegV family protein [Syntrophomonadaceae bacterium]